MIKKVDREKALEKVREREFHAASKFLNPEEDFKLIAELESIGDLVSNYEDRLIDDLAKKIYEEGENND